MRVQSAIGTAVITITKTITVAAGVFAPVEQWYLPASAGQRLQAIAAKNPDCTKASFRFDKTHPFGAD